jgi:hypothetical protein
MKFHAIPSGELQPPVDFVDACNHFRALRESESSHFAYAEYLLLESLFTTLEDALDTIESLKHEINDLKEATGTAGHPL